MGTGSDGSARGRTLRRCTVLAFPDVSLNAETLDEIVAEGYDDVCLSVAFNETCLQNEPFSVEQAEHLARLGHERGLGIRVFTGFMKYQEPLLRREPTRAMVRVDPADMLDSDGLASHWLCPFRPENKEHYVSQLRVVAGWPGLREVFLNDEASLGSGVNIGCYCDHCCRAFEAQAGSPPPRTVDWNDPRWWAWVEYRLTKWVEVHAEFRAEIKRIQPAVRVSIQHSPMPTVFDVNPWKSAVSLANDALALDGLSVDPYHQNHCNLIAYRPHRRILAESTRSLVGACLDRPATVLPQAFMPPGRSAELNRRDGLLAGIVPFALGAESVMPYQYQLQKIIPGFDQGFQETRCLQPHLADHRPYAFATVLAPVQSEIHGHPEADWARGHLTHLADLMNRTGLPWRWFWDQRLDDQGASLGGPLVVPDAHCLTASQIEHVRAVAARGHGVVWVGTVARTPWSGHGACPCPTSFETGAFELVSDADHPLLADLRDPVLLRTAVGWSGPEGQALGRVDGRPALVAVDGGAGREAWLTGVPLFHYVRPGDHGARRTPVAGDELWRRLLRWVAADPPRARLEPFPAPNAYGRLRPWDIRDVPTMELLPLVSDDALLAIVFPYASVAYETNLVVALPPGRTVRQVRELWTDADWTRRVETIGAGEVRVPLSVSADNELLALHVTYG